MRVENVNTRFGACYEKQQGGTEFCVLSGREGFVKAGGFLLTGKPTTGRQ